MSVPFRFFVLTVSDIGRNVIFFFDTSIEYLFEVQPLENLADVQRAMTEVSRLCRDRT